MNQKTTILAVLAVAAAASAGVSASALYAPGVYVVEVDMTKAVGIITTESGSTYARVVGHGGSATYDISDPRSITPVTAPVAGVTSVNWSPTDGVALAGIGDGSYAIVASPAASPGSIEVCRMVSVSDGGPPAGMPDDAVPPARAAHPEPPGKDGTLSIDMMTAYTTHDQLVVTGTVTTPASNGVVASILSVHSGHLMLDMRGMTLTAVGNDGAARTYVLAASDAPPGSGSPGYGPGAAYDIVADEGVAGSVSLHSGLWRADTVQPGAWGETFWAVIAWNGEPYSMDPLETLDGSLTVAVSSWTDSEWRGVEKTALMMLR